MKKILKDQFEHTFALAWFGCHNCRLTLLMPMVPVLQELFYQVVADPLCGWGTYQRIHDASLLADNLPICADDGNVRWMATQDALREIESLVNAVPVWL